MLRNDQGLTSALNISEDVALLSIAEGVQCRIDWCGIDKDALSKRHAMVLRMAKGRKHTSSFSLSKRFAETQNELGLSNAI